LEAACVKCGALTNNMLAEDQPCVSVVQQKVRVAASTFRKGGTLCALCACSSRVNLFKLGGYVQGQVQGPMLGILQNLDWQVAPGLLVDPGHTFLSPLLLPLDKKLAGKKQNTPPRDIAAELLQHESWLSTRVRENRELEESEVKEFVVEKEEVEEMVIPEEEDDAWMLDIDQDDALLLAAACDSNENVLEAVEPSEKKPKLEEGEGEASSSAAKCFKCGQAGHLSRNCPDNVKPRRGKFCHRCKEQGHWAKDCLTGGGGQQQNVVCYQCGEPGHRRTRCPQRMQAKSRKDWKEPSFD